VHSNEYVLEELFIEEIAMLATVLAVTGDTHALGLTSRKQWPQMELADGDIIYNVYKTNVGSA
jgi:hypothetical protein